MIFLIHDKAQKLVKVLKNDQPIHLKEKSCTSVLWEMAQKYPEEIIGWCEVDFVDNIDNEKWKEVFHHDLIMASFAIRNTFLPNSIGYVDQLPFINVNPGVKYPSWLMSTDVGGIKGKVLIKFREMFGKISNLGYLITSIAKLGQQNGLFCYSAPNLINIEPQPKLESLATHGQLFSFVHEHYTASWSSILLWCFVKYENKLLLGQYLKSFLRTRIFQKEVDLSIIKPRMIDNHNVRSIDVIIPTLKREIYLIQVLEDLRDQTLLPKNVIVIEQNPDSRSGSKLLDAVKGEWPFNVIHHFTRTLGACNARNIALKEVKSEWIFFADDDIRIKPELLESVIKEALRYKASALNMNCKQPGEETIFHKVKQWGSFGAGTSIVKSSIAQECKFSKEFEFGFGEDADYGMQLRNRGCDIIYHPYLELLHLKAPIGGFRQKSDLPWEEGKLLPKPSPTLMVFAKKYYTPEQLKGYKVSLFLKFFNRQPEKNPLKYIKQLRERWRLSEEWAAKLLNEEVNIKSS